MNDGSGSDGGAPGAVPGDDRLYFRQLLSGRDFGHRNQLAQQMVNFVYLIGDRQTGEAVVVDPAYDVAGLLGILEADGMRCAGVLATHYHPDHVGGSMMGFDIAGAKELLARGSADGGWRCRCSVGQPLALSWDLFRCG